MQFFSGNAKETDQCFQARLRLAGPPKSWSNWAAGTELATDLLCKQ